MSTTEYYPLISCYDGAADQNHDITSFSKMNFYQSTNLTNFNFEDLDLDSEEEEVFTKRFLYTISENDSEPDDSNQTVTPDSVTFQTTHSPDRTSSVMSAARGDEDGVMCPVMTSQESDSEEEYTMFPDNNPGQNRGGVVYKMFYGTRRACSTATQTPLHDVINTRDDITSCRGCKAYQNEVERLIELLKRADTEIAFMNDEFKILQEHIGMKGPEQAGHLLIDSDSKLPAGKVKTESYARWIVGCVIHLPKLLVKLWTWH